MAKNTFERPPKKQPSGRRRGGQSQFSASLDRFTQWLVGEDNSWASNNFWRIVWVSLLIGVYIYCNLRAESLVLSNLPGHHRQLGAASVAQQLPRQAGGLGGVGVDLHA